MLRSATEGKTQTLLATVGVGATIGGVTLVVGFGSAPFTAGLGTTAATGIALGITVAGAVAAKLTTIALLVRKARNFAAMAAGGDLDGRNPEPCHRGDGLALIAQGAGRSH